MGGLLFRGLSISVVVLAVAFGIFQIQRESYSLPLGNIMRRPRFALTDLEPGTLVGKLALVTGANAGVGFHTALELAKRGCHVVLACRSEERGRAAIEKIKAAGVQDGLLELAVVDLASLSSVRRAAAAFVATGRPLDILVLNAGLNAGVFELTEDGHELSFQVNHLAHHLLAQLLLGSLRKAAAGQAAAGQAAGAAGARVVVLSSDSHFDTHASGVLLPPASPAGAGAGSGAGAATLPHNDPANFDALRSYGQAKLCNVLFAAEFARRLEGDSRILVNSAHPGLVNSGFYDTIERRMRASGRAMAARLVGFFRRYVAPLVAYPPSTAALTVLYLAAAPEVRELDIRGKYFVPVAHMLSPSAHAQDRDLQRRLWELSEALTRE